MVIAAALSALGYGVESSWGNAAAPSAWIPFTALTTKDNITFKKVKIDNLGTKDVVSMPIYGEGSVNVSHFATPDNVKIELGAIFGAPSVSGGVSNFTIQPTPQSATITEWDGIGARAFSGALLSSYVLEWNAQAPVTATAQWVSQLAQTSTSTGAIPPITAPIMGYSALISINGTTVGVAESGKWSFKRKLKVMHVDNYMDVASFVLGELEITAEIIMTVQNESDWAQMASNTAGNVTMTFGWLEIIASNATWETVEVDRSTGVVREKLTLVAVYNNTDSGSCQINVTG